MLIQEDVSSIEEEIIKKIDEIEDVDITMRSQLEQLLYHYKEVFNERPGRIKGYEHYFHVKDVYKRQGYSVDWKRWSRDQPSP